mmetsp:Transcript_97341/g.153380  ORF Transcript_97341/g.153380 Transcript_97341/m.153380 type:complete len:348 (+) Transcript_97341:3-1046(+)
MCGPNALWNYFDFSIVSCSVVETAIALGSGYEGGANLTSLRLIRMLRVAKALRILRIVRLFRALRKMVLSMLASFSTLLWAIALLMIIIFVFGLFLADIVTKHLHSNKESLHGKDEIALKRSFGSIWRAAYSLFLSVSGGISWIEISDPLFGIHTSVGLVFCFYIFFTVFLMLNIITGIFVDTAMSAAQSDKDECIMEELQAKDSTVRQMQRLFEECDIDNSGMVNEAEFNHLLADVRMRAHLASLGIDAASAEGLFRLLDMDNSGTITPEEFLVGCMRVKGNAKAVDIVTLMYENKRVVERSCKFMQYVEKQFKARRDFERRMVSDMADFASSLQTLTNLGGVKRL